MSNDPVITLRAVSKRFGRTVALDDVSLEVPRGSVFALLGENGAGKSTMLRLILGMEQANSGEVTVLGHDAATEGRRVRQKVAYVSDRPPLYDWMTVAEIGWYAAGFFGGDYEVRYRDQCSRFSLDLTRRIKDLSRGMRAKVALSLALAQRSELLILDEPTSGLDPLVRREFLESMVDEAAQGRTVLLASHQVDEVERVAEHVAILRHGRLEVCETLDDLKQHVRELTIQLGNGAVPNVPGTVLTSRREARAVRCLARGIDDSALASLRRAPGVSTVETRVPSLEEILVAYLTPLGTGMSEPDTSEEVAR